MKTNMEELIHHFKLFYRRHACPRGRGLCGGRAPEGRVRRVCGLDGANKPYRLKLRAPGFAHLSAMDDMARGHMIADVVAIIGTMDVVFGKSTAKMRPKG